MRLGASESLIVVLIVLLHALARTEGIAHAGVVDIRLDREWLACTIFLHGHCSSLRDEELDGILLGLLHVDEVLHHYFFLPETPNVDDRGPNFG